MTHIKWSFTLVAAIAVVSGAWADDLLGGGGSSGGGSSVGSGGGSGGGGNSGGNRDRDRERERERERERDRDRPIEVESRPSQGRYRSSNNRIRQAGGPIMVPSIPQGGSQGAGGIGAQARREDQVRYADNAWRQGYYHYSPNWVDDDFWYGHYGFEYRPGTVVISPWYWYAHMPGYLRTSRVQYWDRGVDCDRFERWDGWDDDFEDRGRYHRDFEWYLQDTISDIQIGIGRRDHRRLRDLVSPRNWVLIHVPYGRDYRVRSEDFLEMLADLAWSTRTRQMRLLEVEYQNGYARLTFEHQYSDPWNRTSRTFLRFTMVEQRVGFDVVEFETWNR